jgi:hypothetical protein
VIRRLAAALAGVLLSPALTVLAADIREVTAPYLVARERGAVGAVAGRAYEEARRTGEEPRHYAGVSVLLLPRTESFERELAAIKAGRRDSPERFVEADPKIRAARTSLERALIEAGAGMLLKGEMTDAGGAFRLPDVPEGAWTLLAWHEAASQQKKAPMSRSDSTRYPNRTEVIGSSMVTYWLVPVEVKAGEETQVRLHDRNVWMTAIREDRSARDSDKRTEPGKVQGANPR